MGKQNVLTKINYCNNCMHSDFYPSKINGDKHNNWYCTALTPCKLIELSVKKDDNVEIPLWCPNSYCNNNKQIKNNYVDKIKMWEKIEPIIQWDNIKANTIYHVPPVLNEKRKDILVISKSSFSITYRELYKNKPSSSMISTIYKTNIWWKFMSEHKLKKS